MKLGSRSWDWCVEMTPKVKEKVQKSFLFGKGNGGKLLALHIRGLRQAMQRGKINRK